MPNEKKISKNINIIFLYLLEAMPTANGESLAINQCKALEKLRSSLPMIKNNFISVARTNLMKFLGLTERQFAGNLELSGAFYYLAKKIQKYPDYDFLQHVEFGHQKYDVLSTIEAELQKVLDDEEAVAYVMSRLMFECARESGPRLGKIYQRLHVYAGIDMGHYWYTDFQAVIDNISSIFKTAADREFAKVAQEQYEIKVNLDGRKQIIDACYEGTNDVVTPLIKAAMTGNIDAIDYLIVEKDVWVNDRNKTYLNTPLIMAANSGQFNAVATLLFSHHATTIYTNKSGHDALFYAKKSGHDALVDLLSRKPQTLSVESVDGLDDETLRLGGV